MADETDPKKLRFPYTIASTPTKDGAAHSFMLADFEDRLAKYRRRVEVEAGLFFNAYNASRLTWTRGI